MAMLYPLAGEPVRFESGERATILGVECVEDATLVRANVVRDNGRHLIGVPVAWDPEARERVEVSEPAVPASDQGSPTGWVRPHA